MWSFWQNLINRYYRVIYKEKESFHALEIFLDVKKTYVIYFYRWYFDTKQAKCLKFVYSGCLGNANNFETEVGFIYTF